MTHIFAHRGSAGTHPENTMISFMEAARVQADGIELDVQLSKDGVVVVIHDETVNRTTDGTGWVGQMTYRQLRKLNANYKFKKYDFCPIPSLQEVLEWAKNTSLLINIELKNNLIPYERLEEKVIELVERYDLASRVIFSSFNHESMATCHQLAPHIETALLYMEKLHRPWSYAHTLQALALHPYHPTVDRAFVELAHANDLLVRPFTINKEALMKTMFQYGVDGIFTDFPERAKHIREKMLRSL
ncbi:glycerophosphodiester phosphodiesterase [Anoxybacillus flavithermus]|uniref:glycerophosphodiester phosphodiesterase n=1 Tax=Anoxybacillus flavithermus TaxID=33934 RepID=UPI0018672906|nr:glycerophosphodiester phosphodiesterase [Anoxybacillus flavithermus]MBE2912204.1 glycerophosphodiester phosphodiesterase [Anoxybacillus flavithermus]